ncbi:uncharacterized protein LOC124453899 [Xenia sp. Carnegie-2017]|uniref:uncharacterized protein LOC124453899 n=1 Tax=Xenia sp. Carnegie-2017 TaxID=2897299 RepID=UPI001F041CD8|nr:uncharacterized protein LOC124453899 [Xenia sp. Carnegie-2017]
MKFLSNGIKDLSMFTHLVLKYFFGVFFVKFVYVNGSLVRSDPCRITTTPQNYFVRAPLGSNLTLSFSYNCKGNISWPEDYYVTWSVNETLICSMIFHGFLIRLTDKVDDSYMNSTFSSITINNISIKYKRSQVFARLSITDNYKRRAGFPFYYSRITILVTATSSSSLDTSWIKESLISLSGEVTSLLVNTMSYCNATYTSRSLITSWTRGGMSGSLKAQNSGESKLIIYNNTFFYGLN